MKKWVFFGLMLLAGKAYALSFKDNIQNWRTLETSTAAQYVLLATGCPCYMYDLTVASGMAAAAPTFQYYWSTTTVGYNPGQAASLSMNLSVSSSPQFDVDTSADRYIIEEVVTSSSVFYTKISSSTIRLRWDYFGTAPRGDNYNVGRNPQRR